MFTVAFLTLFCTLQPQDSSWPSFAFVKSLEQDFNSRNQHQPGDPDYVTFYNRTADEPEGRGWRINVTEGSRPGNRLAETAHRTYQGQWIMSNTMLYSDMINGLMLLEPGVTDPVIRELLLLILQHEFDHTPGEVDGDETAPGGRNIPHSDPGNPGKDACEHVALFLQDAERACERARHFKTLEASTGMSQCIAIHVLCRFYRFVIAEANNGDEAERCPELDPDGDGTLRIDCDVCETYIGEHPHCLSEGSEGPELGSLPPIQDHTYSEQID